MRKPTGFPMFAEQHKKTRRSGFCRFFQAIQNISAVSPLTKEASTKSGI
jgi:hypothetical protein